MKTQIASLVLAVTLAGGVLMNPSSADQHDENTIVDLALGFAYDEDFQADDGGWNTTDVPEPPEPERPEPTDVWEWGVPTSGPAGGTAGDNVWATNLDGTYQKDDCAGLMTPEIDLTNASAASVSFDHWHDFRETSFTRWAAGVVFVTADGGKTLELVEPVDGYDKSLSFGARACLDDQPFGTLGFTGSSGGWISDTVDLSDWAGQNVNVVFGFAAGTSSFSLKDGWYIDNVSTTVDTDMAVEDFEISDGNYTIVATRPAVMPPVPFGWEWGEPTTGPGIEPGDNMWATQLHGDYGHYECSWIESTPFEVGPLPSIANESVLDATLSWNHWFRSNSLYASGLVQVGVDGEYQILEPEGGYPGTIGSTFSSYYEVTKWQTDCFGLDWESGDPLHRAYSGTSSTTGGHVEGAEMSNHRADLSAYAGEEITLRYIFASGWRDFNPTTYSGWYVDDVDVELRLTVNGPDVEGTVEDLLGTGNDAPFWTSGGTDSSWAFGQVTDTGSNNPTGEIAYGTNLDDNHNTGECSWIQSPAVPGALVAADPTLKFDHWYRMAFAFSATTATGGVVLASGDGGTTWDYLAIDEYERPTNPSYPSLRNCLDEHGVDVDSDVFTGVKTSWDEVTVSLSDYTTSPTVQVRFLFGSHTSLAYEGWFIRDVVIGGQDVL